MFGRSYEIERFWCPSDGIMELDHRGFLRDPHSYTEWMGQSDSVPFGYIEDVPVLVLLGEPGMGKSQWFKDAQTQVSENIHLRGHRDLWIDLAPYESASDVVEAVIQNEEFVQWTKGGHRLHLFLDSLDECHLRVHVLPKRLLRELSTQHIERLCLRILCRTSEWPQTLEVGLKKLWNERLRGELALAQEDAINEVASLEASAEAVQVFELAPFREEDVVEIAQGEGIEPQSFIEEIDSRKLGPLAGRPQTLAFLIKTYKNSGPFPSDQVELYREGCRELCRESNRERTDAHLAGNFSTEELLAVASRIAALTIFCNRHSILRYEERPDEVKDSGISFGDICQGSEIVGGQDMAVRTNIMRETLNTGLFSGRAGGRMGWASPDIRRIPRRILSRAIQPPVATGSESHCSSSQPPWEDQTAIERSCRLAGSHEAGGIRLHHYS